MNKYSLEFDSCSNYLSKSPDFLFDTPDAISSSVTLIDILGVSKPHYYLNIGCIKEPLQ